MATLTGAQTDTVSVIPGKLYTFNINDRATAGSWASGTVTFKLIDPGGGEETVDSFTADGSMEFRSTSARIAEVESTATATDLDYHITQAKE